jgi:hypothetical protein
LFCASIVAGTGLKLFGGGIVHAVDHQQFVEIHIGDFFKRR